MSWPDILKKDFFLFQRGTERNAVLTNKFLMFICRTFQSEFYTNSDTPMGSHTI